MLHTATRTDSSDLARRLREFSQVLGGLPVGELTPAERAALRRLCDDLVRAAGHAHAGDRRLARGARQRTPPARSLRP